MSFLEKNWAIVLIMIVSGLMLLWPYVQRLFWPVREVSTHEATRMMNRDNALLLDVREDKALGGARLPNAVHVPLSQLAARVNELAKWSSRPVIVYCELGKGGRAAVSLLSRNGFADVHLLQGGFRAWKDAGLPVQKV
jgi:rhodanese-related sulfurtransferase